MKISEFIEKLQDFKKENGDLDIAIYRDDDSGLSMPPHYYYLDINIEKLSVGWRSQVLTDLSIGEVALGKGKDFCGLY